MQDERETTGLPYGGEQVIRSQVGINSVRPPSIYKSPLRHSKPCHLSRSERL